MTTISPSSTPTTIRQRATLFLVAIAMGLCSMASAVQPTRCTQCGVVESVKEIQRDGSVSGLGAAAGAALGSWIANQVGGSDGKTIATIVGLLGGMWAGNAAEKQLKKETVYEIVVRMDDGSLRTLEQSQSFAVGSRVTVDGNTMSPTDAAFHSSFSGHYDDRIHPFTLKTCPT